MKVNLKLADYIELKNVISLLKGKGIITEDELKDKAKEWEVHISGELKLAVSSDKIRAYRKSLPIINLGYL